MAESLNPASLAKVRVGWAEAVVFPGSRDRDYPTIVEHSLHRPEFINKVGIGFAAGCRIDGAGTSSGMRRNLLYAIHDGISHVNVSYRAFKLQQGVIYQRQQNSKHWDRNDKYDYNQYDHNDNLSGMERDYHNYFEK